ncbi:ArnT family glycosyltransferase [Antribacter gilvus]|uniref:ArnT family glycosyltransferase n=1 Tax=Antribacter gilvus TaxID=2304675 RepID=UPI000F7767E7|nr:glycosyltransferase family 39 protein [Antribacter gilvus]
MTALTGTRAPTPVVRAGRRRPAARAAAWVRAHRRALVWLSPVLAVGAVVNLVNLGGAPQRIDDEGTYTAQAWAVTNLGELAHYTYWYDHPPLGWLQLAAYTELTGAFARWDVAVLAAREAVVVASLIATVLLWVLARRVGLSRPAAAATGLIFLVSPLALQFHRTVYLDNVAVPWLLLAFVLATNRNRQLAAFAGSAVAFGVAVLSKETFLLALPVLVWVMLRASHRETRRYTLSVAASLLVLIGGSYLLLAAVKGELFSGADRVSLMDGIVFQLSSRAGSGSLTDPDSLLNRTLGMWWQLDQVFIVLGLLSAVAALFLRRLRPYAALVLGLALFMLRPGGYVPVPYVIALLPFGALLIAGVAGDAVARLRARGATGAGPRTGPSRSSRRARSWRSRCGAPSCAASCSRTSTGRCARPRHGSRRTCPVTSAWSWTTPCGWTWCGPAGTAGTSSGTTSSTPTRRSAPSLPTAGAISTT